MGLITIPTTTSYARTSVSQADIGTATTLGVRISIVGQSLLNAAGSGSQFFVIGNTGAGNGGRLFVAGQTVGDILVLAVSGMGQANPAPVIIQVPRADINAEDHYIIRAWAGPAEAGISLRHESGSLVGSNSGAGATLQFQDADNGRVYCGQYGSVPTLTGAIDGVAVYNTVPPDTVTPPTPDESGLLWAVVDQYGNLVPGAIDLDEFGGEASWTTGGIWDAPAPTITSIDPEEGSDAGGIAVTIIGTGFREGASVSIGGSPATNVTVVSPTTITCTTPAGTAGPSDVVVTNPDGQSDTLENGFTFTEDVVSVRAQVGWVELEVPEEKEAEVVIPTFAAAEYQVFAPIVVATPNTIQPTFIAAAEYQVFAPVVAATSNTIQPTFIAAAEYQIFAPVIAATSNTVQPTFIAFEAQIFTPTIVITSVVHAQVGWVELEVPDEIPILVIVEVPEPAVMSLLAGGGLVGAEEAEAEVVIPTFAAAEYQVFAPIVVATPNTIQPTFIAAAEYQVFAPIVVATPNTVQPTFIALEAQVFTPTIIITPAAVHPPRAASPAAVFVPTIGYGHGIQVPFVAAEYQIWGPAIKDSPTTILVPFVAGQHQVFAPGISHTYPMGFVPPAYSVFAPTVVVTQIVVRPAWLAGDHEVFAPTIMITLGVIAPARLGSPSEVFTPYVVPGPGRIIPPMVQPAYGIFAPHVLFEWVVSERQMLVAGKRELIVSVSDSLTQSADFSRQSISPEDPITAIEYVKIESHYGDHSDVFIDEIRGFQLAGTTVKWRKKRDDRQRPGRYYLKIGVITESGERVTYLNHDGTIPNLVVTR